MRNSLKNILASILVLIGFLGFAQDPLDTTTIITVKPFDPTLSDAIKIKENPSIQDTDKIVPNLTYGFLPKQVEFTYQLDTIKPAKIKGEPLVKLYRGYAKLGFGTNTTPLAELYYNSKRAKEYSFGFAGKHLSSNGIASNDYSNFSDNELSLFGKRFLKDFTLDSKVNFNRNVVHYYGFPEDLNPEITSKDDLRQRLNKIGGTAGLTRNFTDSSQFDYYANANYYHIKDIYNVSESNVGFNGGLSKFHKKELYAIDLNFNYNQLNNLNEQDYTMILGLNPHIKTTAKNWQFKAGIGLFVNKIDKSKFHFYPDAEFKYNVVENIIIPYVGITGGVTENNLNNLFYNNPFINTNTLIATNTNQKLNFYGGIRGSLSKNLTFNTSLSRQKLETVPLFVKDFSSDLQNQFTTVFDTLALTQIKGELAYQKNEKLKLILAGEFNDYVAENEIEAWHKPELRISLNGVYDLGNKILIRADFFYIGKQFAKNLLTTTNNNVTTVSEEVVELKGYFDANLGVEYRYTKKLSAFINFNNIASTKYQRWQDYQMQRFNVLGGLTYSF